MQSFDMQFAVIRHPGNPTTNMYVLACLASSKYETSMKLSMLPPVAPFILLPFFFFPPEDLGDAVPRPR